MFQNKKIFFFSFVVLVSFILVFAILKIQQNYIQASVLGDESKSQESSNNSSSQNDPGGISIGKVVQRNDEHLSWFFFEAKPGGDFEGKVTVSNLSQSRSAVAEAYAVDANIAGGFAPEAKTAEKKGAAWLQLDKNILELQPGGQETISFTGKIPITATPGQYGLSIVSEEKKPEKDRSGQTGAAIAIATRVGVRIYLTVLGKVETSGEIIGGIEIVQKNPFIFRTKIKNTGNTILHPKVKAQIFDRKGSPVDVSPIDVSSEVGPGTIVLLDSRWNYDKIGIYTVKMTVSHEAKTEELETKVIIWPSKNYIIIAVVILLLLVFNIFFFLRRRKVPGVAAPSVPSVSTANVQPPAVKPMISGSPASQSTPRPPLQQPPQQPPSNPLPPVQPKK